MQWEIIYGRDITLLWNKKGHIGAILNSVCGAMYYFHFFCKCKEKHW